MKGLRETLAAHPTDDDAMGNRPHMVAACAGAGCPGRPDAQGRGRPPRWVRRSWPQSVIGSSDVLTREVEAIVYRPLVVGVHAVLARQDEAVGGEQEVRRPPEGLMPVRGQHGTFLDDSPRSRSPGTRVQDRTWRGRHREFGVELSL